MSEELHFDTETTGIPEWKLPSDDVKQPRIVQLAAIRLDSSTREVKQSMDVIIKPEGWVIPEETVEIHGVTQEYAMDVGIPEVVAVEMFISMWSGCDKRIAFNTTFDNRLIRISLKRNFDDIIMESWKEGAYECSMQLSRKVMGVKSVKLLDAYKHFTGKELVDAHTAMADTLASKEVYYAAKDQLNKDAA